MSSTDSMFDGIRVGKSDWNSEGLLLGMFDDVKVGLSEIKMLGVSDSYKFGEGI